MYTRFTFIVGGETRIYSNYSASHSNPSKAWMGIQTSNTSTENIAILSLLELLDDSTPETAATKKHVARSRL